MTTFSTHKYSYARIYACANRQILKYKGYLWIYKEEQESLKERLSEIKSKQRTILQYNVRGELVKEWDCSISKIAKELGETYINIPNCCNGNQSTLGGFIWKYKYGDEEHGKNLTQR